jgi:diaminohydroxyphosphoribosylaminopyrimidine deaminase/5-amino-6-(5-phosphoribosylamino)uracil reductase
VGEAVGEADSLERVRRVIVPRSTAGGLDPRSILQKLADAGLVRLLVEGGAEVARTLVESNLVDQVLLFRSLKALDGPVVPALGGLPLSTIESSANFRQIERRRFGSDMMTRYERVRLVS